MPIKIVLIRLLKYSVTETKHINFISDSIQMREFTWSRKNHRSNH